MFLSMKKSSFSIILFCSVEHEKCFITLGTRFGFVQLLRDAGISDLTEASFIS